MSADTVAVPVVRIEGVSVGDHVLVTYRRPGADYNSTRPCVVTRVSDSHTNKHGQWKDASLKVRLDKDGSYRTFVKSGIECLVQLPKEEAVAV